jgi:hypothetical protein
MTLREDAIRVYREAKVNHKNNKPLLHNDTRFITINVQSIFS